MQNEVLKHYRLGQCDDKKVSREWLQAAYRARLFLCQLAIAEAKEKKQTKNKMPMPE